MSAKNRATLIGKLHKVAKKEFDFSAPPSNRNVLEHLIYGCCLENSTREAADEALAKLQENFCDWNEVRVTTVEELAEVGKRLAFPTEAAFSVKRTLFGVFEKYFTFDLDFLKKENLSKSVQSFEKFKGVSPFVISYVAQNGLGGHSIPLDKAMLEMFYVLGIISESEKEAGRVPGLERTIPKAKGVEFFNVTHPLAVAFLATPNSKKIRDILLKISPDAKERFPKRASKKKAEEPAKAKPAAAKTDTKKTPVKKKATKKAAPKKAAPKKVAPKKVAPKKATKKVAKKTPVKKKATKKAAPKKATKKKVAKKTTTKKTTKKKSATKRLSKKKPR